MDKEKPWWWPLVTDKAWCDGIRKEYDDDTFEMTDDEIRDEYADGFKYADTWDHLGDAREAYEQLADAFLKLVSETGKSPNDFKSARIGDTIREG